MSLQDRITVLEEALHLRNANCELLAHENDALRVKLGAHGIGGGIDISKFDVVFVCRECGSVAYPGGHVCSP